MAQPTIQTSFASGEWAPKLRSRVDIAKYKAGAALLRNFYVDYSGGGASTRPGTRFINQAFQSAFPVRLIPFQPSANLSFVLEFGNFYIRFFSNGAPILEPPTTISAATNANPGVITDTAHGYSNGDWIFITGIVGMVQLNNNYFIVQNVTANTYTLTDLNGNAINTTTYGAYVSGGTAQRVYTLASPYAATDLFPNPITGNTGLKFVQNVTQLIICHQSYPVQILQINSAASWTITSANFGATIATPTISSLTTTLSALASSWSYAYTVTAVDSNGQESIAPAPSTLLNYKSLTDSTTPGSNILTWSSVPGAVSYNVYKASAIFNTTFPATIPVGFIANVTGLTYVDTTPGTAPDFALTPPIGQNPFQGASVQSYTVTTAGTYTTVPGVTVAAPGAGGYQATAAASLGVTVVTILSHATGGQDMALNAGSPNPNGSFISLPNGVVLTITSTVPHGSSGGFDLWEVSSVIIRNAGSITGVGTNTPGNPIVPWQINILGGSSAVGFHNWGSIGGGLQFNFTWGVTAINPIQQGAGYTSVPAVTFSPAGAAATAVLGNVTGGNPQVPGFIQQRLVLASQPKSVQSINMSQPASFFNFNVSFPIEADDGISTQIISSELNDIRSLTQVPTGLIALTGKAAWLLNGGGGLSTADPITPANITAQSQAFNGANDLNPLKINMDILYGTRKGSYIRHLVYNFYMNVFTGTDISVLSNHLFFNFFLSQWCWSEEPFKTVWAVRNDGVLLSLAFVKDQELQGWAHHDTSGQFTSVTSVLETVNGATVDAVYLVVQRQIGSNSVKYVERFADRFFPYGYEDSWSIDCGLQTAPAFSFPTGALVITGNASAIGNSVTLTDTTNTPFTSTMATNAWVVRTGGAIYTITAFTSSSVVTATVRNVPESVNAYTGQPLPDGKGYSIWTPVTAIGGLTQLIGQTVTGVADGAVVPSTAVSAQGSVTLSQPASKVTLGLPFTPQLQTLPLDLGEPTVQAKRKKVPALTMRVTDTLGLQAGTTFGNLVTMKDFQIGAIPTQSNGPALVTDLFTGDGRQILDQVWQEIGQLCVQQNLPYPATILGVMPEVVVGDTPSARPT